MYRFMLLVAFPRDDRDFLADRDRPTQLHFLLLHIKFAPFVVVVALAIVIASGSNKLTSIDEYSDWANFQT